MPTNIYLLFRKEPGLLIKIEPARPQPILQDTPTNSKLYKMVMTLGDMEDTILYCTTTIRRLMRERQKITLTGRLSAEQDLRLDEIDTEVEYWDDMLASIYDEFCDSSDPEVCD